MLQNTVNKHYNWLLFRPNSCRFNCIYMCRFQWPIAVYYTLLGAADPNDVDPRLLTPVVKSFFCCLPAQFRRAIQRNINRTLVSTRHMSLAWLIWATFRLSWMSEGATDRINSNRHTRTHGRTHAPTRAYFFVCKINNVSHKKPKPLTNNTTALKESSELQTKIHSHFDSGLV